MGRGGGGRIVLLCCDEKPRHKCLFDPSMYVFEYDDHNKYIEIWTSLPLLPTPLICDWKNKREDTISILLRISSGWMDVFNERQITK